MSQTPNIPFDDSPEVNRAYEIRRDDDTFKTPSITIYDVDYAIMYYLREKIGLKVDQNGRMVDVPLIYGTGELWSQIQDRGYMRDKEGKLMVPYAIISRTSMAEDDRFRRMDTNYGPLPLQISIRYDGEARSFENRYDLHNRTYNSQPSETYYISVIPEFYVVEYELILLTSYMEQLNQLVQDIIVTSQFVWGDSYKFRTVVGDISFETVNPSGAERLVKGTIPLTVDCRLQNEFELKRSTIQKMYTPKRIVFKTEQSSFDFHTVTDFPNHNKLG